MRNLLIKWLITASTPAIGSTPFPSLYEFVSIKSALSGNLATIAIAVIPFSISLSPASIKVSGFSIKPSLIPFDSDSITIPSGSFVKTYESTSIPKVATQASAACKCLINISCSILESKIIPIFCCFTLLRPISPLANRSKL